MFASLALLLSMAAHGVGDFGRSPWSVQRSSAAPTLRASDDRDAAATEFARGEEAYRSGNYEAAARHFSRAHALVPHPSALFNLGKAQERAGDPVAAWNTYDRMVRDALTPDDRRDALAARERVRPQVALLELRAGSDDAICVDGEHVEVGTSIVLAAAPGVHEVRVGDRVGTVELQAGESRTLDLGQDVLFTPTRRGSRAVVPLLATSSVGSGVAMGLAIAAAVSRSPQHRVGLAGGAAAASGVALGTAIAALVLHTRPARAKRRRASEPSARSPCPRPRSTPTTGENMVASDRP